MLLQPLIDDALLDWLDQKFPNRLSPKELTSFEQGRLVGQQDVCLHLRNMKKIQEKLPIT
jgi:hypothetical protein